MGCSESKPNTCCSDSSDREEDGGGLFGFQKSDQLKKTAGIEVGAVAVAVAGAALLWGVSRMVASDDNRKMMKATGRKGEYILRSVFEDDPKDYFRDLRNKDF